MTTINPWINFNGNAFEAFTFYKSIFGGEFTKIIRFKDMASEDFKVSDDDAEKIMTIVLTIGVGNTLTGNDVPSFMGTTNENENRSKIVVSTSSKVEAETIFSGLAVAGDVEVPFSESAKDTYFGMLRDKYGIEWVVEFAPAQ